ncbi:MAG TPA: hypothetical protein DCM86_00415 [Verrucomicrobiales bacterium]|nr:hypothetical protein [Verrucomicrobiales bacterium]
MTHHPDSTPFELPADSLDDQLRDLGLTEGQVSGAMLILEGALAQRPDVAEVLRRLGDHLSSTLPGACLGIVLLGQSEVNFAEVARRFKVSRQAVQQQVKRCRRKYRSTKSLTRRA